MREERAEERARRNMNKDKMLMSMNGFGEEWTGQLRNEFTNEIADGSGSRSGDGDGNGEEEGRRAKMRSKCIIGEKKKVEVRRRRRERGGMNSFRLTEYGAKRFRRKLRMESESECLGEICRIGRILLELLTEYWLEVPHLRCFHLKENNRKVIPLCTRRKKDVDDNGCVASETITVALMVEMSRRDVCCLNFIDKRGRIEKVDCTGATIVCSCDIRREDGLLVDSTCWHKVKIRGNEEFMKDLHEVVGESRKDDDGGSVKNRYFGSWVTSKNGHVTVDGEGGGKRYLNTPW